MLKLSKIRRLFPLCKKYTYLDTASLALKPKTLLKKLEEFYKFASISDRSNINSLNNYIQDSRKKLANFFEADPQFCVFTSGTTESLNLLAQMLRDFLNSEDEIVLSSFNHSSNIVPWIELSKLKNAKIKMSLDPLNDINSKTKIVALSQKSNNFEVHFDFEKIYQKCQKYGAILINDAAQAAAFEKVSLQNCDAIVASANKMYGPTGLGFLIVTKKLANSLTISKWGGGNVTFLDKNLNWETSTTFYETLEAGTLNLSAIYCLEITLDLIKNIGFSQIQNHLKTLSEFAFEALTKIPFLKIFSKKGETNIIFQVEGVNSQEVALYLAKRDCILRSGDFCAKYLKNVPNFKDDYLRISFGIYNNFRDIQRLIKLLKGVKEKENFYEI